VIAKSIKLMVGPHRGPYCNTEKEQVWSSVAQYMVLREFLVGPHWSITDDRPQNLIKGFDRANVSLGCMTYSDLDFFFMR
jgi:hypothetical protein